MTKKEKTELEIIELEDRLFWLMHGQEFVCNQLQKGVKARIKIKEKELLNLK
jgi:predicted phosphodiesterase